MKVKIKRWDTGDVIFSGEYDSLKIAVEDAVKNRALLNGASLNGALLNGASLDGASLNGASLNGASLDGASLNDTKGLVKIMGVSPLNFYWKRFDANLNNQCFQYRLGLNVLRDGEEFADDPRVLCSYPGFHFGSRSWCANMYPDRPLEALIQIPEDAQINEPWATDGKASSDKIIILKIFDTKTGEEITHQFGGEGR